MISPASKFLIGLAAVALMGWVQYGPAGRGEAFVAGIEAKARQAVAETELTGIEVRLGRDPLSRHAFLSGEADAFQREGQGELMGINDRVLATDGVSGLSWPEEQAGFTLPLLAETLLQLILAYLVGIGLAWLLWGRPRREGFA